MGLHGGAKEGWHYGTGKCMHFSLLGADIFCGYGAQGNQKYAVSECLARETFGIRITLANQY